MSTSLFLFPDKDKFNYEISMIPPQDLPLVFCMCKKKDVKSMKKNYSDIDYFTKPYFPSILPNNLVLLTEDMEILNSVFENAVKLTY